jgi:hypothetical protein
MIKFAPSLHLVNDDSTSLRVHDQLTLAGTEQMKDYQWLADIASECIRFGERHDNPSIISSANALVDAYERDLKLIRQSTPEIRIPRPILNYGKPNTLSNILYFPLRPRSLEASHSRDPVELKI